VIDDSAVVRQTLAQLLSERGGMQVTVAADPIFAMSKMRRERPDVIVLDLELPRMDGLSFLAQIMSTDPVPVVICSALTADRGRAALTALELGAVDIVTKPKVGVRDFLHDAAVTIVDAVRSAAVSRIAKARSRYAPAPPPTRRPTITRSVGTNRLVAVGASTGGTEALAYLLSRLPPDAPGFVVAQHMPEGFTAAFAKRLDELCAVRVHEAKDGDLVDQGTVLIAPGNRHLMVKMHRGRYMAVIDDGPLVSRHRPSVDVLFESVARAGGPDAVGLIMTGMGDDGARGLGAMRQAGALTFAQDESSCVVFGMPKEAITLGAVCRVLPLDELPDALLAAAGVKSLSQAPVAGR
jgi:two-component system chemotaxis response regulator CheB